MGEAQTWTLVGGFLAILVAMASLVVATVRAELRAMTERVDGRLASVDLRLDHLDQDVQRIAEKIFPA